MAGKKTTAKKEAAPAQEFVTKKEFDELGEGIKALAELVTKSIQKSDAAAEVAATAKAAVPATPLEKEVAKAKPDIIHTVPDEWRDKAEEIMGETLERCEMKYLRTGGLLFTLVIKPEFSNAPDNYMEEFKVDRRSKEIGAEGIGGVENWCKLVKQNLARPKETRQLN